MRKEDVFAFAYRKLHQLWFRCAGDGGKLKTAHCRGEHSHPATPWRSASMLDRDVIDSLVHGIPRRPVKR
jgi:hypothetical protein